MVLPEKEGPFFWFVLTISIFDNIILLSNIDILFWIREGRESMAREQYQELTEQMYYILLAIWEPQCGADISRLAMEMSGGRVQIGPGTLYTLLKKFEEQEIIRETGSVGRKRYYVITNKGRRMLQTEYERLKRLIEDGRNYLQMGKAGVEYE